jgi:hypothetical protein
VRVPAFPNRYSQRGLGCHLLLAMRPFSETCSSDGEVEWGMCGVFDGNSRDGNRGAGIECRRIVVDRRVEYDIPHIVVGQYPFVVDMVA